MKKDCGMLFEVSDQDLQYINEDSKGFWENVEIIGHSCFANCSTLKEIEIPEKIWSVSANAFENCSSLEKVAFKNNFISVDEEAFVGCDNLKSIMFINSEGVKFYPNKVKTLKYFVVNKKENMMGFVKDNDGSYDYVLLIKTIRKYLMKMLKDEHAANPFPENISFAPVESSSQSKTQEKGKNAFIEQMAWMFGLSDEPYGFYNQSFSSFFGTVIHLIKGIIEK